MLAFGVAHFALQGGSIINPVMKLHPARKVREYRMETFDGQLVYTNGRGQYSLGSGSMKATTTEPQDIHAQRNLEKAAKQIVASCRWVFNRETEVMDISL